MNIKKLVLAVAILGASNISFTNAAPTWVTTTRDFVTSNFNNGVNYVKPAGTHIKKALVNSKDVAVNNFNAVVGSAKASPMKTTAIAVGVVAASSTLVYAFKSLSKRFSTANA